VSLSTRANVPRDSISYHPGKLGSAVEHRSGVYPCGSPGVRDVCREVGDIDIVADAVSQEVFLTG
jgi:hypothetical protein